MGVPLEAVRKRNDERIAAVFDGFESNLVEVLSKVPYDDLEFWLELISRGNASGVVDALGGVYEACLVFLRREIARLGLPYPREPEDGIAPEHPKGDATDEEAVDDSTSRLDTYFIKLSDEEAERCIIVLRFVVFAALKSRDRGSKMANALTRGWVADAFLHTTNATISCYATQLLVELLATDSFFPPYSILFVLLESALLVPCGNGSTPQSSQQPLSQFIVDDELARQVVSEYVDFAEVGSIERKTSGSNAISRIVQARLAESAQGPGKRVELVKLQIWSLCALFALASANGFDELTAERAPNALAAVADLTRAPATSLFSPLKVAIAETIWCVLALQLDDGWPELYALRMGLNAQLAGIEAASDDQRYVQRLLTAISMGVPQMGTFFPGVLNIATDSSTPELIKMAAGNVMSQIVRDEDLTPSILRSQNAYALLIRELANSVIAVASASTDHSAQVAAAMAEIYAHLFAFWINDSRTPQLEHALINSDFFDICADLTAPNLQLFIRSRTAAIALEASAAILDHTRLEPLVERGTAARFVESLHSLIATDLSRLSIVASMAERLWSGRPDDSYVNLLKHLYQRVLSSPWEWSEKSMRRAFIELLRRSPVAYNDLVDSLDVMLRWSLAADNELPEMPQTLGGTQTDPSNTLATTFRKNAALFAFELLSDVPHIDSARVRRLFEVAKSTNMRPATPLQYYAAQDLDNCVTRFLQDSATADSEASFLLSLDKVALAYAPWPSDLRDYLGEKPNYFDAVPGILEITTAGLIQAPFLEQAFNYSSAMSFVLKNSDFFPDDKRTQLVCNVFVACEKLPPSEDRFGKICELLLLLREITVDWRPLQQNATDEFNNALTSACNLLCEAFEAKHESMRTLVFSVLSHLAFSGRRMSIPLSNTTNERVEAVLDTALKIEGLRARFTVPMWFGKRDEPGGLLSRWKELFPGVAVKDPAAVIDLVATMSDRDFSRNIDSFLIAGDAAVDAFQQNSNQAYLRLVAAITSRLQFPWVSFEHMGWSGAPKTLELIVSRFKTDYLRSDIPLAPLASLLEHSVCYTLLDAHERNLSVEEQICSICRSFLSTANIDLTKLLTAIKGILQGFQTTDLAETNESDEETHTAISSIGWLLVRLIDMWPHVAREIISSGLFDVIVQCTSSGFRKRENADSSDLETNKSGASSLEDLKEAKRAAYNTADPAVVNLAEQCLRVVSHAISTAGVAGERKIIMLVDTPRVLGFDQIGSIEDVKSLILRRPSLRHAALRHIARTSRGLIPLSDVPNSSQNIPPLDRDTLYNVNALVSCLVPEFLGEDLRKAEVTGDALVDLISSVGAAREALAEQFPDAILHVLRRFAPRQAPADTRFGGDLRDTHILETAVRFLSSLSVQSLDEPFSLSVRDSLLHSTKAVFNALVKYMKTDVTGDITEGRYDRASFQLHFIVSVLLTVTVDQNKVELAAWSKFDPKDSMPPFVKAVRGSKVLAVFLETYAQLQPSDLAVRAFRVDVLSMLEEYTELEGYDWPQKSGTLTTQDDDSDDNDAHAEIIDEQLQPQSNQQSMERDVFRNSVLGDIDDENAEDEYMNDEDEQEFGSEDMGSEEMDSRDDMSADELSYDERSDASDDRMSYADFDEGDEHDEGFNDRMSIVGVASDEEQSSSDDQIYLLGVTDDADSDVAATPEIIEAVFSSEEEDRSTYSDDASDSELDDFDPENPDLDTEVPSDVDIVVEGVPPITGFDLMNGVLMRFSNELELLDEPDVDESDVIQPYTTSALSTTGFPRFTNEPSVLSESEPLLAWWNESTIESSEVFKQFDRYFKAEVPQLSGADDAAAIEVVQDRQKDLEPPVRAFGSKRDLATEYISVTTVRMLFTIVLEQERTDMRETVVGLLQYREGRDTVTSLLMSALFDAAKGIIRPAYTRMCEKLSTPARLPREATAALVCANIVGLLCDLYEIGWSSSHEREKHSRTCRRLGRALLRDYGAQLIELLAMPQICQNRRLLHSTSVLVLHVLSQLGSRRFETNNNIHAQLARVLGLRECTSDAFGTLTEIIQKYLRTDVLLPHIIRETRRARSSLLTLLPAVADVEVSVTTVDAFGTEQVKLLRLMSLLNQLYEPQQVLAAIKSVNLLPLWHSVGNRLNNGTLSGPTNGRGFASGVSLLESFALALSSVIKWKPSKPGAHPGLAKYALWMRSYIHSFMTQRRTVINELLRARPNLYLGPMGEMARELALFDFQSKEKWLRAKITEDAEKVRADSSAELRLNVRRRYLLEDTFAALKNLDSQTLRAPLFVRFEKEDAVDAGGVSREWLELIAREILNPSYALFMPTQESSSVYQINRDSGVNPNHLEYFRVVGRILGRAVYDARMIGLYFSRVIYKYLSGRPNVTLADMEAVDEQYYKSLVWMLDMDVTDVIEETFSTQVTEFGRTVTVELVDNGRNISVTEDNKHEYVKRIVEYKLVESVEAQLKALRQGFNDVIAPELVELFDEQELELLICGLPSINVDDWRANTTYVGYTVDSPQIRWFWTAVASFSTEERAKLLQFSTGTSRVPVHGFSHLESNSTVGVKFQIHKEHGNTSRWPSAHTCMNQINLPAYESYKKLRAMLQRIITEGTEGFGFI